MEGFSAGGAESEGGAEPPFKYSMVGTILPFCPGRDSGEAAEPTADEADDVGGEGRRFSVVSESLGALTVDIVIRFGALHAAAPVRLCKQVEEGYDIPGLGGRAMPVPVAFFAT